MLSKKVTRWRNSIFHRKCQYCAYRDESTCTAKDQKISSPWYSYKTISAWRFCTLFEVKDGYEKPKKVFSDSTSGESWSWEGHPGTGPRG